MTKELSEIQIPFCSDFGVVWISFVRYLDIHWILYNTPNFSLLGFQLVEAIAVPKSERNDLSEI